MNLKSDFILVIQGEVQLDLVNQDNQIQKLTISDGQFIDPICQLNISFFKN